MVDITIEAGKPLDYIVELDRICQEVTEAVNDEYQFIVLSDKKAGIERYFQSSKVLFKYLKVFIQHFSRFKRTPLSTLLTLGAVHHHLIEERLRMKVALILETGEARYVYF